MDWSWVRAKSLQLCPPLCNSMDCSPPGSSVHEILQGRRLEWVAMPFSKGSSWPRHQTHVSWVSCIGRWVLSHKRHLGRTGGLISSVKCSIRRIIIIMKLMKSSNTARIHASWGSEMYLMNNYLYSFRSVTKSQWPQCNMWTLSYPTKNRTCTPCIGRAES